MTDIAPLPRALEPAGTTAAATSPPRANAPTTPAPNAVETRAGLRSLAWRVAAFVAIFVALQAAWESARGTWLESLWVHDATVRAATGIINLLSPEVGASAKASRIVAPGGGLNVLLGCEGTDVVFMLAAAFAVVPLPWRMRLAGLGLGLVWVYALNQARIVALFYAFRGQREWFDTLHTVVAPLVVIALTAGFFQGWLRHADRSVQGAPA